MLTSLLGKVKKTPGVEMNAMTSSKVMAAIDRSPFFSELDDETREALGAASKLRAYMAGQFLTKEGDAAKDVLLISRGEVEVRSRLGEGEVVLAELTEGDIVGEVSLAMDVPRTSTVKALSMVEAVLVQADALKAVMDEHPEVRKKIVETVEQRAVAAMEKAKR
jgi:CRP-like cAMP-binding protein